MGQGGLIENASRHELNARFPVTKYFVFRTRRIRIDSFLTVAIAFVQTENSPARSNSTNGMLKTEELKENAHVAKEIAIKKFSFDCLDSRRMQ